MRKIDSKKRWKVNNIQCKDYYSWNKVILCQAISSVVKVNNINFSDRC